MCAWGTQEYDPDLIIGDMLYPCTSAVSEILFLSTDTPKKIPRVLISALPILDPLVPGVLENYPNPLAYIPQMGTALPNDMVSSWLCSAQLIYVCIPSSPCNCSLRIVVCPEFSEYAKSLRRRAGKLSCFERGMA